MRKLLSFLAVIMLTVTLSVAGTLAYQYTLNNNAAEHGHTIVHSMKGGAESALMPAYELNPGADFDWSSQGVMDKSVKVTNQGAEACYYRVILAFEDNGGLFADGDVLAYLDNGSAFQVDYVGRYTVGGDAYMVYVAVAKEPLAGGASITLPMQLAMRSRVTSQDIAPLGKTYTVLSTVQALWLDETLTGPQYDLEAADFGPEMLATLLGTDYQTILDTCLTTSN